MGADGACSPSHRADRRATRVAKPRLQGGWGGGGLPASPCFGATQSMSLEVTGIWEVRGVGVGVAGRVSMISPGVVGEKEGKPRFFLLSFSTALSQPS